MPNFRDWTPEMVQAHNDRIKIARQTAHKGPGIDDATENVSNIALAQKPAQKRKYRNQRVEAYGIVWDSKKELARYNALRLLEAVGQIKDLQRQVCFGLAPAVTIHGKKLRPLQYTADFAYYERDENGDWGYVVEDCKSPVTARETAYRIRRHLMKSVHCIEIREV